MNRKYIYSLWAFMLCLFPALTCAQTLSRYQYWFDDNFSAKMTKSLSGKEREVNVGIDVQQLEDGIHKFSFRVRQSDGMYSAVTSSLFMKTTPGEATLLEYWIDGDMTTSKTFDCQSVSSGGYMVNDYLDLSDVEPGVHRLFLRGRSADSKVVSAITTVPILVKRPMPEGNKVIYWIDDNIDQQDSVSFDSSAEVNSLDLDLSDYDKYPVGFHRLNMKLSLEGQGESSILSDGFFKAPTGEATRMEFWLDGDFQNTRKNYATSASGNYYIFNKTLNLNNLLTNVPAGVHRLFMRAKSSDNKVVSAVTSVPVLVKRPMPEGNKVIYWIDDNIDQQESISFDSSAGVNSLDLDLSDYAKYPVGFHRLNMKLSMQDKGESAILSDGFFKTPIGTATRMEYWLDGDFQNTRKNFSGSESGNEYVFNRSLSLTNVTPGAHRLFMRGRSTDSKVVSAVTSIPIMVKSRYNIAPADVKMTKYSITVDNEELMNLDVLTPKDVITIPYTLDARYLSKGTHTVKAKFWNSMNAGVSTEQQFTVVEQEPPVLTLTAQEQDGLVLLKYNAIPNDKRHQIVRVSENGTRTKVYESAYGCFTPTYGNNYTDAPPVGTYTYYAQTVYEDYNGTRHAVKSNEVTIRVNQSQENLNNCGYIVGRIQQNYVSNKWADIIFSDGVCEPCCEGNFYRERIPVGTVLTLQVEKNTTSSLSLNYDPVTITIKPGENYVYIKGYTAEDMAPNNYDHDLVFDSDLEWIGNEFKFLVKNWTKKTWKGRVRLRAISEKKAQEEEDGDNNGDSSSGNDGSASVGAGSVAPMPDPPVENNYYYSMSDEITIDAGKSTMVTLSLENVFPDTKKDYYVMYIESDGKWTIDPEKESEVKPVAINSIYNVTQNPMTRLIDKSLLSKAEDLVLMENVEYAANLILMVCGRIKAFDGILGNIEEFSQAMLEKSKKMSNISFTLESYTNYLDNALEMETFDELLQDEMVQLIPQTVIGQTGTAITKKLREDIKSDILSNAWDDITFKDLIKGSKYINDYLGKAMKVLKYIKEYKKWDELSTYDKHFYCVDAILNYTEQWNPFSKVLKVYSDVGQAMIRKALEYGEQYYGAFAGQYLYENIPSASESDKFDYNKYVDFKIEVQTNRLVYYNFSDGLVGNGTYQIKDVKVMLANRNDVNMVDTIYFEPIGVWDGVMLKQVRYSGINPSTGGGNIEFGVPLKRMWMEIVWRNGRKSKVPLITDHSSNGVDFVISTNRPYRYIVKFKSGTTRYENIADVIELKN